MFARMVYQIYRLVQLPDVFITSTLFVVITMDTTSTTLLSMTRKTVNSNDSVSNRTTSKDESTHIAYFQRTRREVTDRDALPDQDPRCSEFVQSVLIQSTSSVKDPSAQMITNFFPVPMSHKRSPEYKFQTPNYPDYFPHDMDCIKIISAPTKDHRILLNFRGLFELEPEPHCLMDFFEIRDGAFGFSPILGRYCSRRLPDVGKGLLSSGQFLWLRFHSDSTIRHRGFQAVYRFLEMPSRHPVDNVYRFRYRIDLKPGEFLNLDDNFLLENFRDFPPDLHHLPIEAAFDVRSPHDTHLMIHVANVTVPREFAWSCDPNELLTENPRSRCLSDNPTVFGIKTVKKEYEADVEAVLNRLLIQDPNSMVDGRKTRFEVYLHRSISPYSPPCPKIRRFCDRSIGIQNLNAKRESERDFYTHKPRVVFRILIASPAQKPNVLHARVWRKAVNITQRNERQARKMRNPAPTLRLPQMPTFQFHITALQKSSKNPDAPCDEDWVACDAETCMPEKFWCDEIINCPQWQDEGSQCELNAKKSIGEPEKSSYELRKEQEKQEADEEQMAAQMLHLSILGTLGILLLLVTSTCILMTVRRRKKEKQRQTFKAKTNAPMSSNSPNRLGSRLNHVTSTDALLEWDEHRGRNKSPKFATSITTKSNSVKRKERTTSKLSAEQRSKDYTVVNTANTTHLWHQQQPGRPVKKFDTDALNQTVSTREKAVTVSKEEALRRSNQMTLRSPLSSDVVRSMQLHTTAMMDVPVNELTRIPIVATNTARTATTTTSAGAVKPIYGQSRWTSTKTIGFGSPKHRETESTNCTAIQQDEAQWVPGPAVRTSSKPQLRSFQLNGITQMRNKNSLDEPKTTVRAVLSWTQTPDGKHAANCRLVSRARSWGDGLRTAGTYTRRSDGWDVMHSLDRDRDSAETDRQNMRDGQRTGFLPNVNMTPIGVDRLVRQNVQPSNYVPTYVSMPNVNGLQARQPSQHPSFDENYSKEGTIRGFKPPSAKRPRMHTTEQEVEPRWIPTGYPTDTEEDWSGATAMMDEYGSVLSDSAMPEIQDNPSTQVIVPSYIRHIEDSPYKISRPFGNVVVRTTAEPYSDNKRDRNKTYGMDVIGSSTDEHLSGSGTDRSRSEASADTYRSSKADARSWSDYSENWDTQLTPEGFNEEFNMEAPSSKETLATPQIQHLSPTAHMLSAKQKNKPASDIMVYEA